MHNLRRCTQALVDGYFICLFALQTVKLADISRSWKQDLTHPIIIQTVHFKIKGCYFCSEKE
jgi:rRNA-processing protein FCF1